MIRVVLADDHPIVLDGIAMNLEDSGDVQVVARAVRGSEALDAVKRENPDVLVLDLELPGESGLDVLANVKRISPVLRTVIFTAYGGTERVSSALRAGADAYVLKGTSSAELLDAIRSVAAGRAYLPPAIAAELIGTLRDPARERLTQRETEILRLLADGLSNKAISSQLNIAERTVKFHVSEIFARLGVANRAHAVAVAQKAGLI
ncbi:MAG TPA: response regulator transcription factor [Candidatus Baltobacteraceae bacterium]|nr:response regulator transcription factor [Candidatus Baltobacteraceae bacterium]